MPSNKVFPLKRLQEIQEENKEKFFKEASLFANIRKSIVKTLNDDAMTLYIKRRRILARRHALKKLLKRIKAKKVAHAFALHEAELARIKARKAMLQELAYYDAAHKSALECMEACLKRHDALIAIREALATQRQAILEYQGQRLAKIIRGSSHRGVAALSINPNVLGAIAQHSATIHLRRQQILQERALIDMEITEIREIGENFACDAIKYASNATLEALIKEMNDANHHSGFYREMSDLEALENEIDMEIALNRKEMNDLYEEIKEKQANSDISTITEDDINKLEKALEQRMPNFSSLAESKPSRKRI